jgi:hypothetical protein
MKKTAKILAFVMCAAMLLTLSAVPFQAEEADEYEEKTISYTFDGEEGSQLEESELADTFVMQIVRGAGGEGTVTEEGTVDLAKYAGFFTDIDVAYDYFAGAYTFSLDYDFSCSSPTLGGIFIRLTDPAGYKVTNPKNAGTQQAFDMYEWDWYGENGGKGQGISSIGGSGIRVFLNKQNSAIGVSVKTRVEDGLFVHSQGVEFAYPEGFNASGMNNYKFEDDGKSSVKVYVNNALLATVEYGGEPGTYPDGDEGDSDIMYYKHAVIKDAEGTQLLELDNARISADYSAVGIGNRGENTTTIDNVTLKYMQKKKAATPVPTQAPTAEPTEKPTEKAPDATQNAGDKATSIPADNTKAPSGNDQKKGGNYTWLFIVCGVVAAAAVAVIVITSVKGKKKK